MIIINWIQKDCKIGIQIVQPNIKLTDYNYKAYEDFNLIVNLFITKSYLETNQKIFLYVVDIGCSRREKLNN